MIGFQRPSAVTVLLLVTLAALLSITLVAVLVQ